MSVCNLFCGKNGALWPKPTGRVVLGNDVADINPDKITLANFDALRNETQQLLAEAVERLKVNSKKLIKRHGRAGDCPLKIDIFLTSKTDLPTFSLDQSERYSLKIKANNIGNVSMNRIKF